MKYAPASLVLVFVAGTLMMTRFAMREGIALPTPSLHLDLADGSRPPPASASVEDLSRYFAEVPMDDLRERLTALDLPRFTIEQVITARIMADAEARTHELAREQRNFQVELKKTFRIPSAPEYVAPVVPKIEFTTPEKTESLKTLLRDYALPGGPGGEKK